MNSDPFDPSSPLSVDDIVGVQKNRDAHEQDSRDQLRQASKTVLTELEALGIGGIAELQERMAEYEAAGGEQDAPLSSIALQYFTEADMLSTGRRRDDCLRLGSLVEVAHCIAIGHDSSGYGKFELEMASDKVMEHARFLDSHTHNVLRGYIEDLYSR